MVRSGLFSLTRTLSAHLARILMYHNFRNTGDSDMSALDAATVRQQFQYLKQHFKVVPLLEIAQCLGDGKKLDRNLIALTVDDGRQNFYRVLFPLLKEFGFCATFFVVSSFISGEDWIWTDKVLWLSEQSAAPVELSPKNLPRIFSELNRMPPAVRNERIATLAAGMRITVPTRPPEKYAPCSWAQLREMADTGLVEVGSHTVTHPILSSISDEESWRELQESRRQMQEALGREVVSFCFPNGKRGDYRPSQVQQVAEAGYLCSVVAEFGLVSHRSDRYRLERVGVDGDSEQLFRKRVDGAGYYQGKILSLLGD